MVYFYQLFLSTDDVVLKLYTRLCQKAKCTLFVWSTVHLLSAHFTSKSSESNGLLDCDTPLNFYHLLYLVQSLIMNNE